MVNCDGNRVGDFIPQTANSHITSTDIYILKPDEDLNAQKHIKEVIKSCRSTRKKSH